jgi:hypothetical protein
MPDPLHLILAELAELGLRLLILPPRSPRRPAWRSEACSPSPGGSPSPVPDTLPAGLPDIQLNILDAVGDKHLTARQIAQAAGYRLTNHFRGVLAGMRRAGLLQHDDAGYFRPRAS